MISIHSRRVIRAMPPGLANPVAVLASSLVSPIPTAHRSPVAAEHRRLQVSGETFRIVRGRPDERLVPAPHLDHRSERTQRRHHPVRCGLVRRAVHRKEHRSRTPARRGAQRHPRPHAERAGLVRRRRHDLPRPGGISVAAHHDRAAGELGASEDLHRGQELIEIDVEDPVARAPLGHHRSRTSTQSFPATLVAHMALVRVTVLTACGRLGDTDRGCRTRCVNVFGHGRGTVLGVGRQLLAPDRRRARDALPDRPLPARPDHGLRRRRPDQRRRLRAGRGSVRDCRRRGWGRRRPVRRSRRLLRRRRR